MGWKNISHYFIFREIKTTLISMPAQDPVLRNIKIKTGVVKRLSKEKKMYEKEAQDQAAKVEKMKVEGKDEYDIKKMIEVQKESLSMVPDCQRRLETAFKELSMILETEAAYGESEEYKAAKTLIDDVSPEISANRYV